MKILVTGGAGYVGSHCVRTLVGRGHDIAVLDNFAYGHRAAVHRRAQLVEADLADAAALQRIFAAERYDAVMHFAAFINVGESVSEPLKYYRNNVANTLNLLDAMRDAGVKRLVFSSTCAVYGVPDELPIVERLPKNPINPYGATKLAVEWMLRDSAQSWGLGSVALRYFNAAGAASDGSIGEDHEPEVHLIPVVLRVALGKALHVNVLGTDYPTPDGTCLRDYIHVEDLAEAHLLAIEHLQPGSAEAFNVGTGTPSSVLDVISAARKVTSHAIPVKSSPRRPGDPPSLYANAERIETRFGWKPRFTAIGDIVASAWNWHRAHPDGYGDRKK